MRKIISFLFLLMGFLLNADVSYAQSKTSQISDEQAHEIVLNGTPDDVRNFVQPGQIVNKVKYSE